MSASVPDIGPLRVAWYGDDMTGSVDVMEALHRGGVRAVLFLQPPTPAQLSAVDGRVGGIGVAGMTRTLDSAAIHSELATALPALSALGAPIVHYKVCSTFDSSPETGSIGAGIEAIRSSLGAPLVPVLAAAPLHGRYCAFGNLFARSGSESPVFRLDRHPTMRTHPVTPMAEADLRLHLGRQTEVALALVGLPTIARGARAVAELLAALEDAGAGAVVCDAVDDADMTVLGEALWSAARVRPQFPVVGSAGVEHALTAHWASTGEVTAKPPGPSAPAADRVLAVVGSRSPVSDRQRRAALAAGWAEITPTIEALVAPASDALAPAIDDAVAALAAGRNTVVHSAGASVADGLVPDRRLTPADHANLGSALGAIAEAVVARTGVRRLTIAGGDTSGAVARRMGVAWLEVAAPFAPSMPLCRVGAPGRPVAGAEIVFKGGQIGAPTFFPDVARGVPTPAKEELLT